MSELAVSEVGASPQYAGARTGSAGSILIIDDEAEIRESLRNAAATRGLRSRDAQERRGGPGAVWTSVPSTWCCSTWRCPTATGMEILPEIRERDPAAGVIMITAYGTVENAVRAMQCGRDQLHPEAVGQREAAGRRARRRRAPEGAKKKTSSSSARSSSATTLRTSSARASPC